MSPEDVRSLPVVVDLPTAAKALGVGRYVAYEMVRQDKWPTPVIRVGRHIRVPRAALLEVLGIVDNPNAA